MSEITAFEDEDIPAEVWAAAEAMALESDEHPGLWSLKESLARAMYIERAACAQAAYDCLSLEYQNDYGSLPQSVHDAILARDAIPERNNPNVLHDS